MSGVQKNELSLCHLRFRVCSVGIFTKVINKLLKILMLPFDIYGKLSAHLCH